MNLSTASRTFQLLSRILDSRTPTEPFLPPAGEKRFPEAPPVTRAVLPSRENNFCISIPFFLTFSAVP